MGVSWGVPPLLLAPLLLINGLSFAGKTYLLYYILILCITRAQPIVFQDRGGISFTRYEVLPKKCRVVVPGDDVLALVDADR